MGILRNGILGSITGKVSGVVGSKWKGRNTLRAYAVPSNPNSAAQQTQRGLFTFVVAVAKMVIGTIILDYWNPFATSISGFNNFVKKSLLAISSSTDYANIVMCEGNLEGTPILAFTYITGTGVTSITWDDTILGNGLSTDEAIITILDADHNVAYVDDSSYSRSDGEGTPTLPSGLTATSLHAYLSFKRGSGSTLMVADSSYHVGAAP